MLPRSQYATDEEFTEALRDWFAGQALANFDLRGETPARAAEWAYAIADAMLAWRAKGGR